MPRPSATAASFGQSHESNRPGCLGWLGSASVSAGAVSSAAPRASADTQTRLLLEALSDPACDDGELRRIKTARPRQVDADLVRDPAWPARKNEHPAAKADRLPGVVRDEEDGEPLGAPQTEQLLVEQVAGDGVERCERLIHQ